MADKGPRRGELDGLMGGAVKQKEEEVPAGNGDGNHILWRAESEELGAQSIADGLRDQIHEGAERAAQCGSYAGRSWSADSSGVATTDTYELNRSVVNARKTSSRPRPANSGRSARMTDIGP